MPTTSFTKGASQMSYKERKYEMKYGLNTVEYAVRPVLERPSFSLRYRLAEPVECTTQSYWVKTSLPLSSSYYTGGRIPTIYSEGVAILE